MNIKQKIYLSSGLALIVVLLLFWGGIKPLISEIKNTSALVKESNERLFTLETSDQAYLNQLEVDYKKVREDISLVKLGFLDKDQAVSFFLELEDMATATFNRLEIRAEEFPSFQLDLLGDFPSLMKFLGWLENSKYFVSIEAVQIKGISEKEILPSQVGIISSGDVKTILKIKAYSENSK